MKGVILAIGIGLLTGGSLSAQARPERGTTGTSPMTTASVTLTDAQGRSVGEARLQGTPHGVLLKLELRNATPGVHAMHIHEVGKCEAPSFDSAGEHFAPSKLRHGFLQSRGPHAGDLPNIDVPTTKQLSVEQLVPDVTLEPGPRSLLDADGSALVIHTGQDDYTTDPAGDSGDRIACGAIVQ
jgi:superoxide dismutase, Cu-Zn family